MATDQTQEATIDASKVVTKERLYGRVSRWRRRGEPRPAGVGQSDDGVFGPGSVAWDVLLHPATIVFQSAAQFVLQLTYKPIYSGVRDWDTLSVKARKGTLNLFDLFDRQQRNSGIHAPLWLGDRETAERVAGHLIRIHEKVEGDVIDVGSPELGGYSANSARESMWAQLTEMHSMLWVYESLAFHGFRLPRRLSDDLRDQFVRDVADYCQLFPSRSENLPSSMAELQALYRRDASLFGHSETLSIIPETGQNFLEIMTESVKNNYHPSQRKVKVQMFFQGGLFRIPVLKSVSGKTRRSMGISRRKERLIFIGAILLMPMVWIVQRGPIERYFMRMMWGPDGVDLIKSARKVHAEAKSNKVNRT